MHTYYAFSSNGIRTANTPPWVNLLERAIASERLAEAVAELDSRSDQFGPKAKKAAKVVVDAYEAGKVIASIALVATPSRPAAGSRRAPR
jgi:hypothetical protein